jgi:hypothetical protein
LEERERLTMAEEADARLEILVVDLPAELRFVGAVAGEEDSQIWVRVFGGGGEVDEPGFVFGVFEAAEVEGG